MMVLEDQAVKEEEEYKKGLNLMMVLEDQAVKEEEEYKKGLI